MSLQSLAEVPVDVNLEYIRLAIKNTLLDNKITEKNKFELENSIRMIEQMQELYEEPDYYNRDE